MFHVSTNCGRVYKSYKRKDFAQRQADIMNGGKNRPYPIWEVLDDEQLHKAMQDEVEVVNLMSGEITRIPAHQRGNPAVDVSMEGYWSI